MLPWSVMPTAGMPSRAASANRGAIFAAPSSIEYSVWTCRWTKESFDTSENLPCDHVAGARGPHLNPSHRQFRPAVRPGARRPTILPPRRPVSRDRRAPVRADVKIDSAGSSDHNGQHGDRNGQHTGRSGKRACLGRVAVRDVVLATPVTVLATAGPLVRSEDRPPLVSG